MKKIPSQYHTRSLKASYVAGYRAGIDGKASGVSLRSQDNKGAYEQGFSDGQKDAEKQRTRSLGSVMKETVNV